MMEEAKQESAIPGASLYEWLQVILGCILTAVLIFNCVARLSRVDGQSMDHTLQHNELLLVWSLGYTPKQGDIVIVNKTTADFLGEHAIVKRVIATGGQTVDIDYQTGTVYVDGELLNQSYIAEEMYLPGNPYAQETHFEVPDGEVFVMGDNRNHSTDSRDSRLGTIHEDYILGRAIVSLFPISKLGLL